MLCLLRTFRKHADYTSAIEAGPLSQEALTELFMAWCTRRMNSGDELFRYYGGQLFFGSGFLFEMIARAIKQEDVQFLAASLLPAMGLYSLVGKRNLTRQCFWQILIFITSDEATALELMTALTINTSGKKGKGDATDRGLERKIGTLKKAKAGKFTQQRVTRLSAVIDAAAHLQEEWRRLFSGREPPSRSHSSKREAEIRSECADLWAGSKVWDVPEDGQGNLLPRKLADFKHDLFTFGHKVTEKQMCVLNVLGDPSTSAQPVLAQALSVFRSLAAELGQLRPDLVTDAAVAEEGLGGAAGLLGTAEAEESSSTCDLCCLAFEGEPLYCSVCPVAGGDVTANVVCRRASCCFTVEDSEDPPVCRCCAERGAEEEEPEEEEGEEGEEVLAED